MPNNTTFCFLWQIHQAVSSVKVLCDLVHLRDERQRLPQLGHDLLRGANVHRFQESRSPRDHAERHAGGLADYPGVVPREGLVIGLRTHGRGLAVLAAGAQALQEELQPPQRAVQPQQGATAGLRVAAPLAQVHQVVLQLIRHHRLDGDVPGTVLAFQVGHQDVDLVDGVAGDEAKNAAQAVQKSANGTKRNRVC